MCVCSQSPLPTPSHTAQLHKYGGDTDLKYNKIKCSSKCFGGATERVTYVEQARARHNNTILLDGGGMWHGSTFAYKFKGSVSAEFASQMKYDVLGVDQSDFFNGVSGFVTFLKGCFKSGTPIPVVSSNLNVGNEPMLHAQRTGEPGAMIASYAIVNVIPGGNTVSTGGCNVQSTGTSANNGTKVGVISLINKEAATRSSMGNTVTVQQDLKLATNQAISNLRKAHPTCDKIILLASTSWEAELKPVLEQVEHIDVAILNDGLNGLASYPTIVKHAVTGKKVLVIGTQMYGKEVGHLNVVFDNNGEIKAYDGSAVMLRTYPSPVGCSGTDCHKLDNGTVTAEGGFGTVKGTFPFDATSYAVMKTRWTTLQDVKTSYAGKITRTIDGAREPSLTDNKFTFFDETGAAATYPSNDKWWVSGTRHGESPVGRLCAAALMDHCKDCDGAFNNGGYLRDTISYTAGTNVTFNDILNVFPFQNTISTFRIQGKWFLDVLEHSVAAYDPTDGDGKFFGAVAGFRFAWNPTAPDNSKIAIVQFYNKAVKKWEDLKPQNYYKLATNNYIRGGVSLERSESKP